MYLSGFPSFVSLLHNVKAWFPFDLSDARCTESDRALLRGKASLSGQGGSGPAEECHAPGMAERFSVPDCAFLDLRVS
jgi:hypothetical protein